MIPRTVLYLCLTLALLTAACSTEGECTLEWYPGDDDVIQFDISDCTGQFMQPEPDIAPSSYTA